MGCGGRRDGHAIDKRGWRMEGDDTVTEETGSGSGAPSLVMR